MISQVVPKKINYSLQFCVHSYKIEKYTQT